MACDENNVRIIHKQTTVPTKVATVPATATHRDGSWLDTDIYEGEFYFNRPDKKIFTRLNGDIVEIKTNEEPESIVYKKRIDLTPAQILDLNTNPVQFDITVASDKALIILSAFAFINFNSTPYDTDARSRILRIKYVDSVEADFIFTAPGTFLENTEAKIVRMNASGTNVNIVKEKDVEAFISDTDVTDGDSPISLTIYYTFLDL